MYLILAFEIIGAGMNLVFIHDKSPTITFLRRFTFLLIELKDDNLANPANRNENQLKLL